MDDKLKTKINAWTKRIGYKKAFKCLILGGISGSSATKLLAGTYPNQPKTETIMAIESAMEKSA